MLEAIIRESKEEAGINLEANKLTVKVVVQRTQAQYKGTPTDIIDFFIFTEVYDGKITNKEPEKCSDIAFFPLNNLPEKTMPHVKKALEAYVHGQNFIVS